jgi:hypothetical protein
MEPLILIDNCVHALIGVDVFLENLGTSSTISVMNLDECSRDVLSRDSLI